MSVTFVWIPSSFNFLTTFNPSGIMGILTTTFCPYFLSPWASLTISSIVVPMTSRLTGPLTILTISRMISAGLPFSFESSVGFVVMPSTKPISLYFLIDSYLQYPERSSLFSAPASCFKYRLCYFSCSHTIVLQEHINFLITGRLAKYVVDANTLDGYRVSFANNFRHSPSKTTNDIVVLGCSDGTCLLGASSY